MVGDDVHGAAAPATTDLGLAMGTGTDAAIESGESPPSPLATAGPPNPMIAGAAVISGVGTQSTEPFDTP